MKSARFWVSVLSIAIVTGCGSPKPVEVSDDQLNHYAGIAEHDHPVAGENQQVDSEEKAGEIKHEEHSNSIAD